MIRHLAALSAALCVLCAAPLFASSVVDVRDCGAAGDGTKLDTKAIQAAIDRVATDGGGQVRFSPGRYLSGTICLRSHVALLFEAGATLVGTTNLDQYAPPAEADSRPGAGLDNWHRGLIVGANLEDVTIAGDGVIDGHKVFDPHGEEGMRGPHAITFMNCHHFTLRDVTIIDAANYAVFFQTSDDIECRNLKIVGGWDGIHWRGTPDRWCHNVTIIGCQFYTGDDAIAGCYWNNTVIQDCLINSSCNGIRLIGPATRLTVADNLFRGPGERPHLTSRQLRRTNMLAGIILQPGAWDATRGALDDVLLANNVMQNVAAPVTLWIKPGNTAGRVTVSGLNATGVYRSALSFESWADAPITNVALRNVQVEYLGGGKVWPREQPVKAPGVDARPLPAWGLYARNVTHLTVEDVRLGLTTDDFRPVMRADNMDRLILDNFKFPRLPSVVDPIVTNHVAKFLNTP